MSQRKVWAVALAIAAAGVAGVAGAAAEQAEGEPRGTFGFLLENDGATGTDRHYTNGMEFTWLSAPMRSRATWRYGLALGSRSTRPTTPIRRYLCRMSALMRGGCTPDFRS